MKYYPTIDLGSCSQCLGCMEIAPDIFYHDMVTGMIRIIDLDHYPESLIDEAIKNCPKDCIKWDIFQLTSSL